MGHVDFDVAKEAALRVLSQPNQFPPQVGQVLEECEAVAIERAAERRREIKEREEKQRRLEEQSRPKLSPEEAEAGRQRGLSILRDCIAKMEAKKSGVK